MSLTPYRIDPNTGAVIFKKSAGRRKAQQTELRLKELEEKIQNLENIVQNLENLVQNNTVEKENENE